MVSVFSLNTLSPFFMLLNESLVPVIFCLFVFLILPRLKTGIGTFLTLVLLAGFVLINLIAGPFSNFWLRISVPTLVLIGGYFIVVTNRILKSKKIRKKTTPDSNENDKTLGLFYQQQGMLDLAFERYQSIHREEELNDLLYSLGLEYEKKGQIKKALDVYKFMFTGQRSPDEPDEEAPASGDLAPEANIGLEGDHVSVVPLKTDEKPTIGRYRVSGEIGKNSIGVIFRGQDPKSGMNVAIKTIEYSRFEENDIPEIRAQFFRETECLRQLIHPNILTVYDCGEEKGMFYLVMDELEGESLKEFTKKGLLLPMSATLSIIGRAADALEYAHRKNIVHQNIRPDSIIRLSASGDIKVKDFGLGWFPSAFTSKTESFNEPNYMSPEQIAGEKVDARSDVFSLGIVLFEMLTGEKPFAAEDMPSTMLRISNEGHPSPRFYNPKIPRVIEKIIDSALEKDLEKRYQSAGQMAIHLKKVVARINELMEQKRASNPSS